MKNKMAQLEKATQNENSMVSLMAELESQSTCPRLGDCETVRQYGIRRCCDDFGNYCLERDKENKPVN